MMSKLKLPKVYQELSDAITHEDDIDDIEVTVTQGVLRRACMQISGDAATIERVNSLNEFNVYTECDELICVVYAHELKAAIKGDDF
jgi:hypothetical protein